MKKMEGKSGRGNNGELDGMFAGKGKKSKKRSGKRASRKR